MRYGIRYRNYKGDRKPKGNYLIKFWNDSNGKEHQKQIAFIRGPPKMNYREQKSYLEQKMLVDNGYTAKNSTKFTKRIEDDHIREVRIRDMNTTITDIKRNPKTKRWKREKIKDRDYLDNIDEEHIESEKI